MAYRSKYNKHTLDDLMYEMTLEEFLEYQEYIQIHEDMERAANEDQADEIKRQRNK